MTDTNTAEREALMNLADAYAQASFDQGLHQRTLDDAPEEARAKLEKALRNALAGRASLAASAGSEPLTDSYVQMVPDKCDRIVWRNHYYHLPLDSSAHPSPPEGMAGWISVDERLPEPDVPVLAHNGKWTGVAAWMSGEYLEPLERWQDEHREFIEMMGPAITHWRELPAPPLPASEAKEL